MIPKKIEVTIQKTLVLKCFQKTSDIKNGKPVCPEKKRSAPVLNKKKFGLFDIACRSKTELPSIIVRSGNGPICVRVMKAERIKTKTAILFIVKGRVFGFERHMMVIQVPKIIGPYTNNQSTSKTGILLKKISETAPDALSNAYDAAK